VARNSAESAKLLANATATGPSMYFGGGSCLFMFVPGTGGATVTLQILGPDGTTWIPITGASGTTAAAVSLSLPSGNYRVAVTGGTTPAGIHAQLLGVLA
jgi:alpha-D-ribose 1-methylphosphonate 5-phosphate C-P lyase